MNAIDELRALFEADQADRREACELDDLAQRDRTRRERVEELLTAGALQAADYWYAALIFQHGELLEHYRLAHELALHAAELGDPRGRRLAAMAIDRRLVHQGKPQKYGTQFFWDGEQWRPREVDPMTTDAERAEWDVPPIAVLQQEFSSYYSDPPAVHDREAFKRSDSSSESSG